MPRRRPPKNMPRRREGVRPFHSDRTPSLRTTRAPVANWGEGSGGGGEGGRHGGWGEGASVVCGCWLGWGEGWRSLPKGALQRAGISGYREVFYQLFEQKGARCIKQWAGRAAVG